MLPPDDTPPVTACIAEGGYSQYEVSVMASVFEALRQTFVSTGGVFVHSGIKKTFTPEFGLQYDPNSAQNQYPGYMYADTRSLNASPPANPGNSEFTDGSAGPALGDSYPLYGIIGENVPAPAGMGPVTDATAYSIGFPNSLLADRAIAYLQSLHPTRWEGLDLTRAVGTLFKNGDAYAIKLITGHTFYFEGLTNAIEARPGDLYTDVRYRHWLLPSTFNFNGDNISATRGFEGVPPRLCDCRAIVNTWTLDIRRSTAWGGDTNPYANGLTPDGNVIRFRSGFQVDVSEDYTLTTGDDSNIPPPYDASYNFNFTSNGNNPNSTSKTVIMKVGAAPIEGANQTAFLQVLDGNLMINNEAFTDPGIGYEFKPFALNSFGGGYDCYTAVPYNISRLLTDEPIVTHIPGEAQPWGPTDNVYWPNGPRTGVNPGNIQATFDAVKLALRNDIFPAPDWNSYDITQADYTPGPGVPTFARFRAFSYNPYAIGNTPGINGACSDTLRRPLYFVGYILDDGTYRMLFMKADYPNDAAPLSPAWIANNVLPVKTSTSAFGAGTWRFRGPIWPTTNLFASINLIKV